MSRTGSRVHHMTIDSMQGFIVSLALGVEPNPPAWPPNVHVFSPAHGNISAVVQAVYANQDLYQDRRTALFFQPGVYEGLDVPVGYYTTVHGLGAMPGDVAFTGPLAVHQAEPGANLVKFWRGAENLANRPRSGRTVWSVSQAAPLRRMAIEGDLVLGTAADTQGSGGYVSGLRVSGKLNFTMQQQWIVRNSDIAGGTSFFQSPPRSVNFVYVGTSGAPLPTPGCTDAGTNPVSPSPQQIVVDATPIAIEKPFIVASNASAAGGFALVTPVARVGTRGPAWAAAGAGGGGAPRDAPAHRDGFERVFVATNATAVAHINEKLALGLHVVLTPGIYQLPEPIRVGTCATTGCPRHQVLLGLGLATLVPTRGGAAVEVVRAAGVRVAGVLLQAGPQTSRALLTVADGGGGSGGSGGTDDACLLADVFARVGGPGVDPVTGLGPAVSATVMAEINASNVVLDNVWLWRADVGNGKRSRDCNHSLVVNGDNVTAYGLAAEHVQSDNVVWNGEGGRVYFYQAELDGLANSPGDHTHGFGPDGVSGYRVNAREHRAAGVGVYCWFSNPGVVVEAGVAVLHRQVADAIECPFQWVWENANTPPKGNSTIETAIRVIGRS
eukprot:g64.t1